MCQKLVIGLLAFCIIGCATKSPTPAAMSQEWSRRVERQREWEARQAREKSNGGEMVLVDGERGPRTYVYMDEKGRPRLGLGDRSRLSADIDIGERNQGVGFKYRMDWGGTKRLPELPSAE